MTGHRVATVAAAALLLAACSSTTAGSATGSSGASAASSTVPTSTALSSRGSGPSGSEPSGSAPTETATGGSAPAEATISATAASAAGGTTAPPADDAASAASQSAAVASLSAALATATPVEFDTQTAAWFEAMCAGLAGVDPAAFDNDGNDNLSPIEEANYFRALGASFTVTSQAATNLPPPTIDGGADLVVTLSSSLATAGTDFGGLVDKATATVDGPNQEIADILQDASRTYIGIAYAPLVHADPTVLKALHPLPSCAAVGW